MDRVDCECENPKTRRHTEYSGPFKSRFDSDYLGIMSGRMAEATTEYDLLECLECGNIEPRTAASEICTISMREHYDSDCAPTSYEVLMRKGNRYYVLSKTRHEGGTQVHGRKDISAKEADELIAEYGPKPTHCRDCERELEGRRDYHIPYLCHVCAGIRVEAVA